MTRRYRWSGVPVLDLFQEGVLGLLGAAERFDWTRGTPFAAYAAWWVRHAMSKAVQDATASVHLPSGTRASLRRLAKARSADPSSSWRTIAERACVDPEAAENLLPLLGPENFMWASDYPHPDSTFPHSRKAIAEAFEGLDAAFVERVTATNCAKLYGFA